MCAIDLRQRASRIAVGWFLFSDSGGWKAIGFVLQCLGVSLFLVLSRDFHHCFTLRLNGADWRDVTVERQIEVSCIGLSH
jgi:hypothetical protein